VPATTLKQLEQELAVLQRRCRELRIPVLLIFEGLSASGKGSLINSVILPMDPRGFKVSVIREPSLEELSRPFLWRFWRRTPSADKMAIFDRSWYRIILERDVAGKLSDEAREKAFADIRAFERQFHDSGTVIVKFHLNISKSVQAQRLKDLRENPATAWRVTDDVMERHNHFDAYNHVLQRMLKDTDHPDVPWEIIDADDMEVATYQTLSRLIDRLNARVRQIEEGKTESEVLKKKHLPYFEEAPQLSSADLSHTLDSDTYLALLEDRQHKIHLLQNEVYRRRIPVVIVYEGQDAAGKGGNIRRLCQRMDPRGYEVIPVAAPNEVELAHHYLWRFWVEFPKAGHITIFDRSWYGRVLVERLEGFCSKADWRRAYQEINEMEENFFHFGSILVKFWLQIDKEEQLKRFRLEKQGQMGRL
jgi:polyphosphate:AMP phosphotransferase